MPISLRLARQASRSRLRTGTSPSTRSMMTLKELIHQLKILIYPMLYILSQRLVGKMGLLLDVLEGYFKSNQMENQYVKQARQLLPQNIKERDQGHSLLVKWKKSHSRKETHPLCNLRQLIGEQTLFHSIINADSQMQGLNRSVNQDTPWSRVVFRESLILQ